MDLFEFALQAPPPDSIPSPASYPHSPGYQNTDTSREAAASIAPTAGTLQALALKLIIPSGSYGFTAEELAVALNVERAAIQPRTTELKLKGQIEDGGSRRRNKSGKRAIVWIATKGENANV